MRGQNLSHSQRNVLFELAGNIQIHEVRTGLTFPWRLLDTYDCIMKWWEKYAWNFKSHVFVYVTYMCMQMYVDIYVHVCGCIRTCISWHTYASTYTTTDTHRWTHSHTHTHTHTQGWSKHSSHGTVLGDLPLTITPPPAPVPSYRSIDDEGADSVTSATVSKCVITLLRDGCPIRRIRIKQKS